MARATWSGYIGFGLVNVPVKLFTAARSHDVHFTRLHDDTHARVRRRRVDEQAGEEVAYELAQDGDISGRSSMSKEELADALASTDESAAS